MKTYKSELIYLFNTITPIPDDEMGYFLSIIKKITVEKNNFFMTASDIPKYFGINISGILRLFYSNHEGKEFTKFFWVKNTFGAAYGAFIKQTESHIFVEAVEDSVLLVINYKQYMELLERNICWQIIFRRLAEEMFVLKEKREYEFLFNDAATRYKNFIEENPGIEDKVKQYQIASYLGINPVSLSRLKKSLHK